MNYIEDKPWCPWGCSKNQIERTKWADSFSITMLKEITKSALEGESITYKCHICEKKIFILVEMVFNFSCQKGE